MEKQITIGITDTGKYDKYARWFEKNITTKTIKLDWATPNFELLNQCDGIVLSGGEDVHPKFYNKPEYLKYIKPEDIVLERDIYELDLIKLALKQSIPILGICRGLQIANVYFGGTLIPDIPSFGNPNHSSINSVDTIHSIDIQSDTELNQIIGLKKGEENSSHHQSADLVADVLKVSAVSSEDGIIEALEWKNPEFKSFLLLVQWHPERMLDQESPLSKNIRDYFLQQVRLVKS